MRATVLPYTYTLTQTEVTFNKRLEAIACRVRFNNTYLTIYSLYLPPNPPFVDNDITSLISQLPDNRLVLGDFNAHHQQWVIVYRYREESRPLAAYCRSRGLSLTQTILLGDLHPDVVDTLMVYLTETNLIRKL